MGKCPKCSSGVNIFGKPSLKGNGRTCANCGARLQPNIVITYTPIAIICGIVMTVIKASFFVRLALALLICVALVLLMDVAGLIKFKQVD